MFDATIKAQWSHHGLVVLLKLTGLHFFAGPSTERAMLFRETNQSERGFAEALDQTDDSENEETEAEERHGNISLITRKIEPFPNGATLCFADAEHSSSTLSLL